ncbi:MAG: HAD family hydrolase [Desulfobulbaceae bacterium]|jgi:putative hydrolase of the HAD superfamily|nr:HAD family hydrolase [Desulfobulbaceae bacterium]
MKTMIRGLIFDINGTTTDILTNEGHDEIYRILANFLDYQGIALRPDELREMYFAINRRQRKESGEEFAEFDAAAVFKEIISKRASDYTGRLPAAKLRLLPGICAEVFRAASRFKLELYAGVSATLAAMKPKYQLAALSDGQSLWGLAELHAVGLDGYFDPVLISSDFGYRKPDPRLFAQVLKKMRLTAAEVIFIGNDMYRDVFGAKTAGLKTVFFKSNQGDQRSHGLEADYIIYNFPQLLEAVRFLEAAS